jgi:hypothetical protein
MNRTTPPSTDAILAAAQDLLTNIGTDPSQATARLGPALGIFTATLALQNPVTSSPANFAASVVGAHAALGGLRATITAAKAAVAPAPAAAPAAPYTGVGPQPPKS